MDRLRYILGLPSLSFVILLFSYMANNESSGDPTLRDSSFKLEKIVDGLSHPTGISFLKPNDFLVIERTQEWLSGLLMEKSLKQS
jgi:glucose/arabinose dehydrogenase